MFARIIVPLDGSALAASALPYALRLADATGASLSLVRVVTPLHVVWDDDVVYDAATEAEGLVRAGGALDSLAERLRAPGRRVEIYAAVGDPADEILRYTERTYGDLIVMATHGRGGIARWAIGSVARKVLMDAPAPTLIVRPEDGPAQPEEPAAIRRILVPLDGSTSAETVVPPARDVAHSLGARVTLARVVTLPTVAFAAAPDTLTAPRPYPADTAAGKGRAASLADTTIALDSGPADVLLDLLNDGGYDLVVISTHGWAGPKRQALGGVSERLIASSRTPVLLLRAADAAS